MPMKASISRPRSQGGERQAGIRRTCAAADQPWPGRLYRPVAQPPHHLEGVQHQLGAPVSGGGPADGPRADLHNGSGADDCGPTPSRLKPATRRRLGAESRAHRPDGRCPLLHGIVARPGALQRNGPAMAQRLAVAPTRILCTVRSHTAPLRPGDGDVNLRLPRLEACPDHGGEPAGLVLGLRIWRHDQQSGN